MELQELRKNIDEIDNQLVALFEKRMTTSADILKYKHEHNLAVLDAGRERQKLTDILDKVPEEMQVYTASLYSLLFELSRTYQNKLLGTKSPLPGEIEQSLRNTPKLFPTKATVACQGVEGAYSQLACEKLFQFPNVFYFSRFDGVFAAIEKGLCRYGIIPVENSTAGSVNEVYDLMMQHNFRIVRSVRLKVDHCLVAKRGVKTSDIKEIYSHEQAINQCSDFLRGMPGVKIIHCENTSAAAKAVSESERTDIAALASRSTVGLYGLDCLAANVQNEGYNFTRFICISKEPEIYPGADRTSLMMVISHRPGSLYKVLSRFYAQGINLNKLESRPIPGRNFEFMFYFDLDTSVYSEQFLELIDELDGVCESFSYLGSYSEIV